jgi:hypothetical protein
MGKLAALVESDKPSPETVLWLINRARSALGLRPLSLKGLYRRYTSIQRRRLTPVTRHGKNTTRRRTKRP